MDKKIKMKMNKKTNGKMKINRTKPQAFTLIELLVVISIIALLVSILMPALSKARKQAKDVLCKNNVRQLTLTFTLYASDNNGKFPYRPKGSFGYPHIWWAENSGTPDNRVFFDGYLDGFILKQPDVWTQNVDYAPEVMYCPMTSYSHSQYFGFERQWPTQQFPGWRPFETSYAYFNMGWPGDNNSGGIWRSKAKMPKSMSSKGYLPLWGDLIEIYGSSLDIYDPTATFRQVNHFKSGFKEYVSANDELPEGMNVSHVDGSVNWYSYDRCEVYWSGFNNTVQNVWARPY